MEEQQQPLSNSVLDALKNDDLSILQRYPAERSTTIETGSSRLADVDDDDHKKTRLEIHNTNDTHPRFTSIRVQTQFSVYNQAIIPRVLH
mmetsp:Transcript_45899/g.53702  ORF Transcript_45899/g.53702 Transcript_45899/m.53702 type:complete len:90 (+) Transcript_45899:184-453(+)